MRAVAKGLVAAGIEAGDRVALISKTRYEWTLLDYAIWFAGAVTVPVYETSSSEQIQWILDDSGARAVVAETPEHVDRVTEVRGGLTELNHVWSITDNAVAILGRLGEDISEDELEARRTASGPGDLATLIYTSGHDRPPQGLHAHPRQLHGRARRRCRAAGASCSRPRTPRRSCSCRWLTCSRGSSRWAA